MELITYTLERRAPRKSSEWEGVANGATVDEAVADFNKRSGLGKSVDYFEVQKERGWLFRIVAYETVVTKKAVMEI